MSTMSEGKKSSAEASSNLSVFASTDDRQTVRPNPLTGTVVFAVTRPTYHRAAPGQAVVRAVIPKGGGKRKTILHIGYVTFNYMLHHNDDPSMGRAAPYGLLKQTLHYSSSE